jgi:heme-degrading monooxygenase HmoA
MFVIMADVLLKESTKSEFKVWFSESNKILSKADGFVSRRLLKSPDGSYRILLQHQSKDTFEKMIDSEEHKKLNAVAVTFMIKSPTRMLYEVLAS